MPNKIGDVRVSFLKDIGHKHILICHLSTVCFPCHFSLKRGLKILPWVCPRASVSSALLGPTRLSVSEYCQLACALPWLVRLVSGTAILCFLLPSLLTELLPFLKVMVLNTPSHQSCLLCPQSPPLPLLYSGDPSEVCLGWCSLCLDFRHRPLLVVGASGLS